MTSELTLSAENRQCFDTFYQRRLYEAGNPRDDSEELELARDILAAVVNDGLTPTADGGASYVRRGAVDWTDPATMQAARTAVGAGSDERPQAKKGQRSKGGLLQGVAMVAVILLGLGWFFWPAGEEKPAATPANNEVGIVTPEATGRVEYVLEATPTPLPTLETELLADVVGAGAKTKQLVVPRTLEVKGVSFIVQPVKVGIGDWPLPEAERAVSWVHGTVINYVMGLEGSPANKKLLASLQPGNQMLLRMSTGVVYRFIYADTVRVPPQAAEIFWQNRPGLTLVLLGERAETRVVIRALYVPETELEAGRRETPVERVSPGQRVVLDDRLRLTYLDTDIVPAPETLQGYAYLGVNVGLEYVGGDKAILTTPFMHHISADGLTYPLVSAAAGGVPYPPLPERLLPRHPVTTTVVYAVPLNVLRQELRWEFVAEPGEGEIAQALIPPYEGLLTPAVVVKAVETDTGSLLLTLEITAALHNLTLQTTDIGVQGGTINPIGNTFPWRLRAGTQENFVLVLTPDGSGTITITLLEQGIEVTYGS